MISKWKMEMLTFLTSLTLVSVGFSSWQISSSPIPDLSATVGVDSVVHTDNFVSLGDPTLFEYNAEDGCFITYEYDEDGNVKPIDKINVANFTLNYNLNLSNCKSEDSPFLSYYENETDFGYYSEGVITCIISFNTSNQTDINFFDDSVIETFSKDATATINGNSSSNANPFSATISRYTDTSFKLEFNFLIAQTFALNTEIIPIVCKFEFTVNSEKMSDVCESLANGGNFTFHTILSGE